MAQLRKRLGNAGVDISNPKNNESFVLIGTPLPPLEKTKDANEFVPLWKQEVRDEKGRRRLHGAFTGGFSAGYFNSVGSKEGWTPSTFKSSRNDRSKNKAARPEDFMDEEDLAELAESRKLVDQDEVASSILPQPSGEDDSISSALANLLPSLNESIGAQMLKKMGWKPGQGIGPRLTYDQLKRRNEMDGTPMPAVEDEEARRHTYAPRDTKVPVVQRKDDFHGLGYTSMPGLRSRSSQAEHAGPKISAGFGLGALNDAEDDDVDIYDNGLPRGGRQLAFEAGEDDDERLGLSKASTSKAQAPTFQSAGFFKNGAPLLSGFVIADLPVPPPKKFDPPQVPEDWTPNPNRVWDSKWDVQPSQPIPSTSTVSHEQWKKGISADERGTILGETPLSAAKKSIWDYMSQKDRERLQTFQNTPQEPRETVQAPTQIDIPRVDPPIAKAALLGYQPFTSNPVQQARYTAYLTSQASSQSMALQPLPQQSIAEFNAELEGFAKAARVFKPMSAAMASRFRTSSTVDAQKEVKEGLYQPPEEAYTETSNEGGPGKMEVEETPKEHAARLGMFGSMTRETAEWAPARLLCKRFKVPVPKISEPEPKDEEMANQYTVQPDIPAPNEIDPDLITGGGGARVVVNEGEAEGESGPRNMATIGLGEDATQGADTLTYQRPAMDIFKAIFASDEENSDDENEKMEEEPAPLPTTSNVVHDRGAETKIPEETNKPTSGPVDMSTFRPTFVSRSNREGKTGVEDKASKIKKKSKAAPLSFMDEEGEGLTVVPVKKRKRDKDVEGKSTKKKKDKDGEEKKVSEVKMDIDEDDDSMWVEKPAPVVVQSTVKEPSDAASKTVASGKSRPKAADFL